MKAFQQKLRKTTPGSLKIYLLGSFRVAIGGTWIEKARWQRRRPRLLIKLLALQPLYQLHREQIMEFLWPEADPQSAAENLHKTIHLARRALEPGLKSGADSHFVITQDQQVLLRAPGKLWTDLDAFEQKANAALESSEPSIYEAALSLYKGDLLLEDIYQDWTAMRRDRARNLYQHLLASLAQLYETRHQYARSIKRLNELVGQNPSDEETHRRLMRLYALTGNRNQVERQFRECCESLRKGLDAEPSRMTLELHEQINSGQIQSLAGATHPGRKNGPTVLFPEPVPDTNMQDGAGPADLQATGAYPLILQNRLAEAQHYLDAARTRLAEAGLNNQAELAHLHDTLAHLQWYGRQFTEAVASVHTRLHLATEAGALCDQSAGETVALDSLLLGDWERCVDQESGPSDHGGDAFNASDAHLCLCDYHMDGGGGYARAGQLAELLGAQARRTGAPRTLAYSHCCAGTAAYYQGKLREAVDSLSRGAGLYRKMKAPGDEAMALHRLGMVRTALGDCSRAQNDLKRALRMAESIGPAGHLTRRICAALAQNRLEAADNSKALSYAEQGLTLEERQGRCLICGILLYPAAAAAYAMTGRLDKAQHFAQLAESLAGKYGSTFFSGVANQARARVDGVAGHWMEALAAADRAQKAFATIPQPYEMARTHMLRAALRMQRNGPEDFASAASELKAALALFSGIGNRPSAAQARRLLRRLGTEKKPRLSRLA